MSQLSDFLVFLGVSAATLAACYLLLHRHQRYQHSALSYPPGPNPTSMPTYDPWIHYRNWGRKYGKLVYIRANNTLIINDAQTAIDLLEERARIYSDRLVNSLTILFGSELMLPFKPYSAEWRRDRKQFQQSFRQATISQFFPAQYTEVQKFLHDLTTSPEDFMQHTMVLSQRLIYASLYGLDIGPADPLMHRAEEVINCIGRYLMPGFYPWAERFPWLRFMPSWFPGCKFKQDIQECRKNIREVDLIPFDMALNNLKMGLRTSLIAELAVKSEGDPSKIEAVKAMGTISLVAAADTTMASTSSFLLCMALHPDIQKKGQEELDCIVGRDRLPTFDDRHSLPYVEAIYRELMRFYPPIPLGGGHTSIEDDVYDGYLIPKGCLVTPNVWAMNRDPNVYREPENFIPERFLDSPNGPFGKINDIYAFGFGRRVCPGRYMAENTVWLTIASFLATMTISKAKDSEGNEIEIPGELTHSFFCHPVPYKCSIMPRTAYAKELILTTHSQLE